MKRFGDERAVIIRLRDVFSQPRDLMGYRTSSRASTRPDLVEELMRIFLDPHPPCQDARSLVVRSLWLAMTLPAAMVFSSARICTAALSILISGS